MTEHQRDGRMLSQYQPPANRLLGPERLAEMTRRWATSPLVRVEDVGRSIEGRQLWLVRVGRRRRRPLQRRARILFCGGAFGFEAAHVEAQAKLVDLLLDSRQRYQELLDGVEVLVMPMPNPDGRAAAMRQWKRQHFAPGFAGCGNALGFVLNRDFFTLTQPETRAIHDVYNRYRPDVVVDSHEDMFGLGITFAETCWCPPFRHPYHPLIPRDAIARIDRLGAAVAAAWRSAGYDVLHDPAGKQGVLSLFKIGGRLHLDMAFHSVPTLVTESGRTPGVQTWDARVDQKVYAYEAVLSTVSAARELFIVRTAPSDKRGDDWVLTPIGRDPLATAFLAEVLDRHGVRSSILDARAGTRVVAPTLEQTRLVWALLGRQRWNTASLPDAFGVRVRRVRPARQVRPPAQLTLPSIAPTKGLSRATSECYVVPNAAWGIALANRGLAKGLEVYQLARGGPRARERPARGALVFRSDKRGEIARALAGQIGTLGTHRTFDGLGASRLRRIRVALYAGQGVDEQHTVHLAEERWALRRMGFDCSEITARDVTHRGLRRFDVLVVPGGHAQEIVAGWSSAAFAHSAPWRPPGRPHGIGQDGIGAIRAFVERGGGYVGLGSGGGVLGCTALGIVASDVLAERIGEGIATLRVRRTSHPVAWGLRQTFHAYYYSEPAWDIWGAPVFRARRPAVSIASYTRPKTWRTTDQTLLAPVERVVDGGDAILSEEFGAGRAVIIGISPNFRASWPSTAPLLSNALWYAAGCTSDSGDPHRGGTRT